MSGNAKNDVQLKTKMATIFELDIIKNIYFFSEMVRQPVL